MVVAVAAVTMTTIATKSKRRAPSMFTPAAWQWDPLSVTSERVQWWSAGGSCSTMSLAEARKLVAASAAFVGSDHHVCQVHERIDGANAPVAA